MVGGRQKGKKVGEGNLTKNYNDKLKVSSHYVSRSIKQRIHLGRPRLLPTGGCER